MKNKTKILALMLCLSLFGAMALGSGSSSSSDTKDIVSSDGSTTTKDDSEDASETSSSISSDVTIEEQVLVDQDGIKITATGYEKDSLWGDEVQLLVENDTDTTYTITCDALIVNDYMISDLFVSEVAAGKKANETVDLYTSELNAAGIDTVGKIEIYFHAYDSETYDTLFDNVYCEIQTSEYANMDTTPDDSGMELYNENGIRIVGKTVDENSFWGTAILLYIENNSGSNVGISVDEMSINGYMMDPFFATTVYDGKRAIDDVTIFSSDLEDNGIESIDEVELKFHIYDVDSYDTIADSDAITFSAQ